MRSEWAGIEGEGEKGRLLDDNLVFRFLRGRGGGGWSMND